MGWLRLNATNDITPSRQTDAKNLKSDITSIHIEQAPAGYNKQAKDVPADELPFVPAHIVRSIRKESQSLWIVIDDIIYDCTEFVHEHPGGNTVIESFNGEDCSWQFWRFHSRHHLNQEALPLRIGRTEGVKNRFEERPRFQGLRRHGADDEW